jgi:histidine triad (HIT) family protein
VSCIFCRIVAGELPSDRLFEDDRTLAFMDNRPGPRGHSLVIPQRHAEGVYDVDPEELAAVARTAQRVARAAKDGLGCGGVNLVQSTGAVAFQTVFHLHFHVIPRYEDDDVRLPWLPKPGDPKSIADAAAKLRAAWK